MKIFLLKARIAMTFPYMKRWRKIAFYLVSLCFVSTALSAKEEPRPNILFCIADDWGWPHAGAYGEPVVQTPTFDRIARQGVLFHHAYISSPSCTPSRNAILTGQWHWRLGPGGNLHSTLDQKLKVYPHILAKAGYHTGYWRKSWGPGKLDGKWKKDPPAGKNYKKGFAQFLAARPKGEPFCFWLGASDPHRPYETGSGRESGMDLSKIKLFPFFPESEVIRSDYADYFFEVQRFDDDVAAALKLLEETGELDNTIVVITGDHGMPFPRCKSNVYDSGSRVPLVLSWPAKVKAGQVMNGFVSLTDLAPTFLSAAGVAIPDEMTGRDLLPAVTGGGDALLRQDVLFGKERHVPSQEAPDMGGYPTRALRTADFLYIRNYEPYRWPNGTPFWEKAAFTGAWFGDTDGGPTKNYIADNKDKDEAHRRSWDWCFAKRPADELYDLKKDPDQLHNVAAEVAYAGVLKKLTTQLTAELAASGDPRHTETPVLFDTYPYTGGTPKHPDFKK
ncbi:MAG: sulfatase [Verrucomicrobiota bacterium]